MDIELNLAGTWPDESPDREVVDDPVTDPPPADLSVDAGADEAAVEAPEEGVEHDLPDVDFGQVAWYGGDDLFVFDAGYAAVQAAPGADEVTAVSHTMLVGDDIAGSLLDEGLVAPPEAGPDDGSPEVDKAVDATPEQAEVDGDASTDAPVESECDLLTVTLMPIEPIICILIVDPILEEWPVAVICPEPVDEPGLLYYGEAICGLTDVAIPVALAI